MLAVHLFAPFRVIVAGERVCDRAWQGRIPRSLLQLLALSPQGQTSDQLIEHFWPHRPLETARQSLYVAMSRLRKAMMPSKFSAVPLPQPIVRTESGYRLIDSARVDVWEFHAHVARVRQLRTAEPVGAPDLILKEMQIEPGALLVDQPYADWALRARERVARDLLILEQTRAELLCSAGRIGEALEAWLRVLEMNPLCELAGREAMRVALDLGDRTKAMNIYSRLQRHLMNEWGVGPAPETLALYRLASGPPESAVSIEVAPPANRVIAAPPAMVGDPPAFLTRFIGRERELKQIEQLLLAGRFVTLQGVGGAGKTRLAFEAAERSVGRYAGGICWLDLGAVGNSSLFPQMIAAALGIQKHGQPLWENVLAALHKTSLLLIVDQCEHMAEDVARLVVELLRGTQHVSVLATSQKSLGVAGEVVYRVPALSLPIRTANLPTEATAQSEAVRLFLDRASAVRSNFSLTSQNVADIVRICRRLDGIPLAIEIAAARMSVLTASQVAERLDRRFELLRIAQAGGLERHQSLLALFDWSYALLSSLERRVWEQMSVFAGSFTLEAAEEISRFLPDPLAQEVLLDALTELVDRSILQAEELHGTMRYRFSESMREYGLIKLEATGRKAEVDQLHRAWSRWLVENRPEPYSEPEETQWIQ